VLENLSSRAVEARFEGDFAVASQDNRVLRAPSPVIVPARDTASAAGQVRVFLQADFTAKELAENYEAHEQGRPLPHRAAGTVSVRDDRDNGTTDTWDLTLTGCPIQPHPTRGSVWVTVPFHVTEGDGLRSMDSAGAQARAAARRARPRRLMPRHSRPQARVVFSEPAEKQIEALTDEAALLTLDRALAVLSVDPDAGADPRLPPGPARLPRRRR
jgi:hypothetical protein